MLAGSERQRRGLIAMRLLTACVVAVALTTTTAKKKKRRRPKVDARTEQQRLCDACMGLAEHALSLIHI